VHVVAHFLWRPSLAAFARRAARSARYLHRASDVSHARGDPQAWAESSGSAAALRNVSEGEGRRRDRLSSIWSSAAPGRPWTSLARPYAGARRDHAEFHAASADPLVDALVSRRSGAADRRHMSHCRSGASQRSCPEGCPTQAAGIAGEHLVASTLHRALSGMAAEDFGAGDIPFRPREAGTSLKNVWP